jgi:preprotein translocase subunit SecE
MALKVKKVIDEQDKDLLKEVEKVSKEVEKKEKKKDKKDNKKKEEKKAEVKKESWWHGVKSEFKKVRWPSKKEMIKYSIATIVFILFFLVFFAIIEFIAYLIKTM